MNKSLLRGNTLVCHTHLCPVVPPLPPCQGPQLQSQSCQSLSQLYKDRALDLGINFQARALQGSQLEWGGGGGTLFMMEILGSSEYQLFTVRNRPHITALQARPSGQKACPGPWTQIKPPAQPVNDRGHSTGPAYMWSPLNPWRDHTLPLSSFILQHLLAVILPGEEALGPLLVPAHLLPSPCSPQ